MAWAPGMLYACTCTQRTPANPPPSLVIVLVVDPIVGVVDKWVIVVVVICQSWGLVARLPIWGLVARLGSSVAGLASCLCFFFFF